MTTEIRLTADVSPAITYAFQHNAVPVVHRIDVINSGDTALDDLTLLITSEPGFAEPLKIRVQGLEAGERRTLNPVDVRLSHGFLATLNEALRGYFVIA